MIKKTGQFLREVVIELKKCEWPVKRERTISFYDRIRELVDSTIVVIVSLVIVAGFIAVVDFGLTKLIRFVLK